MDSALVKMAFRNLFRRKFRTSLLVLAMGLSFAVLLFFRGLAEGGYRQMAEIVVRDGAGHVVVEGRGYRQHPGLETSISDADAVLARIRRSHPGVRALPRIFFEAIAKTSSGTLALRNMVALRAPAEKNTSFVFNALRRGAFPARGSMGVVLGAAAAARLGLSPGDHVLIITRGLKGSVAQKLQVSGIYSTGLPEQERQWAFMELDDARTLLDMRDRLTQIAIYKEIRESASLAADVGRTLDGFHLDVLPWYKALPMLSQFIAYHNSSIWLFQGIIFFIVTIIIMNGLFMAVLERTREIGVLRAIGMTRRQCFTMISYESLFLGMFALGLGLTTGLCAVWYSHRYGIDPTIFTGGEAIEIAGGTFSEKIYAELSVLTVLWTSSALLALAWIASVLPALRAAGLSPVTAMRKRS